MKTYRVRYTETHAYYMDVEAESEELAMEIAEERYADGEEGHTDRKYHGDGVDFYDVAEKE